MFKNSIESTRGSEVNKFPKEIKKTYEVDQFLPKELDKNFHIKDKTEKQLSDLRELEKKVIMKDSGWSKELVDGIASIDEYLIYRDAGLQEVEIAGKKCLVRNDIDWKQVDEKGRTNIQRMEKGLAPIDKNGEPIELHHIGQHANSPLAELTSKEHRCNGNDTILHNKTKQTEVHGEGNNWVRERQDYWKNRVEYGGNNNE